MKTHIRLTPPPTPQEWEDTDPPTREEQRRLHWVDHEAARLRTLLREHGWRDWGVEVIIEP